MRKTNLVRLLEHGKKFTHDHQPEILMGLGVTGMLTSTVLAVRATPKALELLEEARLEKDEDLTTVETVKACWKCYIPATALTIVSVGCLIGSSKVSARRTAALAAAYQLSETALSEYRAGVLEEVGEKKERVIREKVAEQRLKDNPVQGVIVTNKGTTLCFDPISARYFRSDIDRIRKAENELNKRMLHDMGGYVSLNEFYDELGLDHISVGDDLGWNTDNLIDIVLTSKLTDDDEPAVVLDFTIEPKYEFDRF